jgi:hypothetical protein
LDDHFLCQREVAERDARIRELEEERDNALHKAKPMEAALKIASTHLKRIAELEAENARLISDGLQSAAYIIEMRDLRSRIRELETALTEAIDWIGASPEGGFDDVVQRLSRIATSQFDKGDKP